MFSPPVGTRSPTWAVARDSVGGMSNEAMVHEMLYNPAWQLPASDLEQAWGVAKDALEQDEPLKSIPEMNLQELQVRAQPRHSESPAGNNGIYPSKYQRIPPCEFPLVFLRYLFASAVSTKTDEANGL